MGEPTAYAAVVFRQSLRRAIETAKAAGMTRADIAEVFSRSAKSRGLPEGWMSAGGGAHVRVDDGAALWQRKDGSWRASKPGEFGTDHVTWRDPTTLAEAYEAFNEWELTTAPCPQASETEDPLSFAVFRVKLDGDRGGWPYYSGHDVVALLAARAPATHRVLAAPINHDERALLAATLQRAGWSVTVSAEGLLVEPAEGANYGAPSTSR